MYVDAHAHFDDDIFSPERQTLIENMKKSGVDIIINSGFDVESSKESIKLAEKYDFFYAGVGIHPEDSQKAKEEDILKIKELTKHKKVVAISEIGLDYHYEGYDKQVQKYFFEKQLLLAHELDLPVVIHSRDAAEDTFEIIKNSPVRKGMMHAYSYSPELAKEYLKLGFYISAGGVVTFKNGKKLRNTVEQTPIDRLITETDSPYMAPEPLRGSINNSSNIKYILSKIAEIKGLSEEETALKIRNNMLKLFPKIQ
ncbi:MAG: TatD family hydrolase [Firmicutes bacterium]|nr:TatD family hydrolase [Bacillota bacterium]